MFTLNCKGTLLTLDRPAVMGIINVNNNSFFKNSRHASIDDALNTAKKMLEEGATFLDVGGQSTSPESLAATAFEELERVVPTIEAIIKEFPETIISIDTFYAEVAKAAVNAGAKIVNDISAGDLDNQMLETVAALDVPFIAMHMKGTPQTMKNLSQYENVTREVLDYFIKKIDECNKAGIKDVIVDVGFGFAKNIAQNFELMKNLSIFKMLEKPLLVGVSRKSTIYKTLHTTPENALNGTTVLNTVALQNGANIIRVHDVKEAMEAVTLLEKLEAF
ncbi:dihydropteroate synthase [Arachidicoccus ginsenosidimutans]|uniref:dihydropteroate synthase n=1 Tax=Arachidicoccus sp. BS20 TaxID=1850526 RepID=UPI0007F161CA|nr:dihydropteroate synthase [Arachidicoccus sp. BS20]ANI89208.1 dihydropteroate synthase [Arachidicoccus sp. BS20]